LEYEKDNYYDYMIIKNLISGEESMNKYMKLVRNDNGENCPNENNIGKEK
jgi:hypothetical protein